MSNAVFPSFVIYSATSIDFSNSVLVTVKYLFRSLLMFSFSFLWNVVGFQTNLYLFALASILVPSRKQSSTFIPVSLMN